MRKHPFKKLSFFLSLFLATQVCFSPKLPAASFPFSFWQTTSTAFPSGKDGALSINGTTVFLAAGSVKDYSSISITNGGSLNITGPSAAWTILGCSGNFTIDSTSNIVSNTNGIISGTTTATTPDGHALSYTINVIGIGGGYGGDGYEIPGASNSGNGGGGGGLAPGDDASTIKGGNGGANGTGLVATGAVNFGDMGDDAFDDNQVTNPAYGGGGGGGGRGYNGGGLSITVGGTVSLTGSARIHVYGQEGGPGGAGGSATSNSFSAGGGGGGGGNGGSGGKIDFRWKGVGTNPTPFCVVNGGAAGGGGGGGSGGDQGGFPGGSGDPGANGSLVLSTY